MTNTKGGRGRPRKPADHAFNTHTIRLHPNQSLFAERLGDDNLSGGIRIALEHYMREIRWADDVYPHVICPDPEKSNFLVGECVRREMGIEIHHMATGSGHVEPDYPNTLAPYLERYRRFDTRVVSPEIRNPDGATGPIRWIERDGQRVPLPEFNVGTGPLHSPVTGKPVGDIGIYSPMGGGKPRFLAFSSSVPAEDIEAICRIFREWDNR